MGSELSERTLKYPSQFRAFSMSQTLHAMRSLDSEEDSPLNPMTRKRMKFSLVSNIYPDIPWARSTDALRWSDAYEEPVNPLQSNFHDSLYSLRTEIGGDPGLTPKEMVILVFVLLLVFFVVWLIVQRVLLLEIETEMHKQMSHGSLLPVN
jgi:hypothetical protein